MFDPDSFEFENNDFFLDEMMKPSHLLHRFLTVR